MGKPPFQVSLHVAWILITLTHATAHANEEPYCGLYSMHAALKTVGVEPPDFDEFARPEYLSGSQGSTASDLIRLAEKNGAAAAFVPRMSVADLEQSPSPIILHTSVAMANSGFHHWVLFLGIVDGDARLYDPPLGMYTVPIADLLSYWDGSGVVVAQKRNDISLSAVNHHVAFAFLIVILTIGVQKHLPVLTGRPASAIVATAIASGTMWHCVVGHGLPGNNHAIANVSAPHMSGEMRDLSTDQFLKLAEDENVIIIDARRPISYDRSHIPDAINVPITATHGLLRDTFRQLPRDRHIITYCHSETCDWADAVALQFRANGYHEVSIFRGGFKAWMAATRDP